MRYYYSDVINLTGLLSNKVYMLIYLMKCIQNMIKLKIYGCMADYRES